MYVVRRPFRNYGEVLTPGSIIEPGNIKRFKSRLSERVIVEVTAQTFDNWNEYFIEKFGVTLALPDVTGVADETASYNTDEIASDDTDGITSDDTDEITSYDTVIEPELAKATVKPIVKVNE